MNPFILVICIPLVILSAVVLAHYMKKKIPPPYRASPSFLDDFREYQKMK